MTVEELAEKAILSRRTLDNLLAGVPAFLSTLNKVALALQVECKEIILEVNQAIPSKQETEIEQRASGIELTLEVPDGISPEETERIAIDALKLALKNNASIRIVRRRL